MSGPPLNTILIQAAASYAKKWPTPNYVDPPERTWLPAYIGVWLAFGTIMVWIRLGLRVRGVSGHIGLDDVFLFCAWILGVVFSGIIIYGATRLHLGRHTWDIPLNDLKWVALCTVMDESIFIACGGFTKISVLLFYRRLAGNSNLRWWRIAVLVCIIFTGAWSLGCVFAQIFHCIPVEASWRIFDLYWAPPEHVSCIEINHVNLAAGVLAMVSDIYTVVLPCIVVRTLQLPRKQKVALNILFCLSLFVTMASCVRIYYVWKTGNDQDGATNVFDSAVWIQVELQLGLMCASASSMRVLFRQYLSAPVSRVMTAVRGKGSNNGSIWRSPTHTQESKRGELLSDDSSVKHLAVASVYPDPDGDIEANHRGARDLPSPSPYQEHDTYMLQDMKDSPRRPRPAYQTHDRAKGHSGRGSWF